MKTAILLLLSIATFALAAGPGASNGPDQPYLINMGLYQLRVVIGDSIGAGDYRDSVWIPNTPDGRGYAGVTLQYYTSATTTLNWLVTRPTFNFGTKCPPQHGDGGFKNYYTTCYGEAADTLGDGGDNGTKRTAFDMHTNKYGTFVAFTSSVADSIPTTTNAAKRYLNCINTKVKGVPITGWWFIASTTNYNCMILFGAIKQ